MQRVAALVALGAVMLMTPVVRAQPEQAPNPYGAPPPSEEGPPPEFAPPAPVLAPGPAPVDAPPPPAPAPAQAQGAVWLPPEALPKPKIKYRFSAAPRVSLSYIYANDDHLVGANIALDLMGVQPKFGGGATLQVDLGRTVTGLTFAWLQWGARFRWRLADSRVQIGFGFSMGFMFFERVTVPNDPLKAFTFGPDLDAVIDLVQLSEGRALFLTARTGFAGVLLSFQPIAAHLSAGLGFRF